MTTTAVTVKADKKQKRKELNQQLEDLRRLLKGANEDNDLLRHFPSFQSYCRKGIACDVVSHGAASMPPSLVQWALELCKLNMQALYEPVWGWNNKKKKRQLEEPDSRFLVAFEHSSSSSSGGGNSGGGDGSSATAGQVQESGTGSEAGSKSSGSCRQQEGGSEQPLRPLAYVNFRFDQEGSTPVVYCYELQLEERAQRKGLGKFLMRLLELMGAKYGMQACMLTVMKGNTSARSFYASLGYSVDPISPQEEECGYQILSKSLVRRSITSGSTASVKAAPSAAAGKATLL